MPSFRKTGTYRIDGLSPSIAIKDNSFKQCIKLLILSALLFFIIVILAICYFNSGNYGYVNHNNRKSTNAPAIDSLKGGFITTQSELDSPKTRKPYVYTILDDNIGTQSNRDEWVFRHHNKTLVVPPPELKTTESVQTSTTTSTESGAELATTPEPQYSESDVDITDYDTLDVDQPTTAKSVVKNKSKHDRYLRMDIDDESTPADVKSNTTTLDYGDEVNKISSVSTLTRVLTTPTDSDITEIYDDDYETDTTTNSRSDHNSTTIIGMSTTDYTTTISYPNSTTLRAADTTTVKPITPECPTPAPVCSTVDCKRDASRMLARMDHNGDPCQDFHTFACGGAKDNRIIDIRLENENDILNSGDLKKLDTNKKYVKKFNKYLKSCVQYNKEIVYNTISVILRNLHTENSSLTEKDKKLSDLIGDIILFGHYASTSKMIPVFDVIMDVGPNGTFIPKITVPTEKSPILEAGGGDYYEDFCKAQINVDTGTEINVKNLYESYTECMKNSSVYENLLMKSMQVFNIISLDDIEEPTPGGDKTKSKEYLQDQEIKRIVTSVIWDIVDEIELMSNHEKNKRIQSDELHEYVGLSELELKLPGIDWRRLFAKLFKEDHFYFHTVKIENFDYLTKIFNYYNTHKFEDIKYSIIAMIAHDMYIDFVEPTTSQVGCDRKTYCLKIASQLMSDITSRIVIDKFDDDEIKNKEKIATQIFKENKLTYIASIENSTWLDVDEKGKLISKLNKLDVIVNSTGLFKLDYFIDSNYEDLEMIECFFTNTLKLKNHRRTKMYETNGKNVAEEKYLWTYFTSPIEYNPVILEDMNRIILPFRFLMRHVPGSETVIPNFQLYSRLSFEISREIAAFFIPRKVKTLISKDNEVFNRFVNINLIDPEISRLSNPYAVTFSKDDILLTFASRFQDDSALRIAYETYNIFQSSNLTKDLPLPWVGYETSQLFYMSLAQQFCKVEGRPVTLGIKIYESDTLENYFRLNSMVMNSNGFSKSFDCGKGTSMNPALNIEQFPYLDQSSDYADDYAI